MCGMAHPKSKKAKSAAAKRKVSASKPKSDKELENRSVRISKKAAAGEARQSRKRKQKIQSYAFSAAAVIVVLGGLFFAFRPGPEIEGVERPDNDGRGHITNATYSSSTPTSGAHRAQSPNCGVYSGALQLDLAVHALEHGVVVLWYDATSPDLASQLTSAVSKWDSHVIIAPSAELDAAVVATAWNRRMRFAEVTESVTEFVDVYRNRGPETVRCDIA
jgi:hypothetical protein